MVPIIDPIHVTTEEFLADFDALMDKVVAGFFLCINDPEKGQFYMVPAAWYDAMNRKVDENEQEIKRFLGEA